MSDVMKLGKIRLRREKHYVKWYHSTRVGRGDADGAHAKFQHEQDLRTYYTAYMGS